MFRMMTPMMNSMIKGGMFDTTCEILGPDPAGNFTSRGVFPCNVQATSLSSSSEDHSVAQSDDMKYIYLFLDPAVEINPGDRVLWGERIWNVGTENTERASQGLTRVILTDWQIAVEPELITFYRVRSGVRSDIGTFSVHVTLNDFSTLASAGRSAYQGDTAMGEIDTGTMVGGPELSAVVVGDWFQREGLPGRVTSLLHSDEERARLTFSLDREAR